MIYVATKCGKSHSASEDTALVGTEIFVNTNATVPFPQLGFICVADGVGGNCGGAKASSYICTALAEAEGLHPDMLQHYLCEENEALIQLSNKASEYSNMATTLSGVYVVDDEMFLFHVGNSRVYAKQGNYLKQLTSDHTTYNWLLSTGNAEAALVCNKSEITNCFGGGNASLISKLTVARCNNFSSLLLTSDGIHDYVDIDHLESILNGDAAGEEKCMQILSLAQAAGSKDDMTVILACRD
jgi:protein phosphatase